eukprot:TRINITY_DN463_c0_g3_i1.p1 TRINITY_DN463_c0_g3~~TRINITY_DN463_c0_g3_i1.p1  ORF type:complete len:222 (-),score=67.38 TRINITY_DN463_c0_g3_i1:120-785(-)
MVFGLFGGDKTLKRSKKKKFDEGTHKYEIHKYAKTTLGILDLREAIRLPEETILHDWLAVHAQDFFNQIMMVHGLIESRMTEEAFPEMSAGHVASYLWQDPMSDEFKKPTQVSAAKYCECLFLWVERQLDDKNIFPNSGAYNEEPFMAAVKNIFKRMFRVYAHLYYSHYEYVCSIGADAHINTCFKHFILFANEFNLIAEKELKPLEELIHNLLSNHECDE